MLEHFSWRLAEGIAWVSSQCDSCHRAMGAVCKKSCRDSITSANWTYSLRCALRDHPIIGLLYGGHHSTLFEKLSRWR